MHAIKHNNENETTEIEMTFDEYAIIISTLIAFYQKKKWIDDWELPAIMGTTRKDIKEFIKKMAEIEKISPEIAHRIIPSQHMDFIRSLD